MGKKGLFEKSISSHCKASASGAHVYKNAVQREYSDGTYSVVTCSKCDLESSILINPKAN